MGRHDFAVDLEGMANAAKGINDTSKLFKDKDVEDLIPSEGDVGHDTVWDALDEFQDRWERGTKNMVEDVGEAGGRLAKITMNYLDYEQSSGKRMEPLKGEFEGLTIFGASE
ncbi:hypothetical protein [Lapillicoccus sp.]|uniref:hypothetical protein n=1 Tax=Lapillicoccus sp. TaxID=1909287 RepID=UPI003264A6B9